MLQTYIPLAVGCTSSLCCIARKLTVSQTETAAPIGLCGLVQERRVAKASFHCCKSFSGYLSVRTHANASAKLTARSASGMPVSERYVASRLTPVHY